MLTIVSYPAKISSYSVKVSQTSAFIRLFGFENSIGKENENNTQRPIGDVHFLSQESQATTSNKFINRGGFVNVNYPISMLSSILLLINQNEVLFINQDGVFTNSKNTIQS